MYDVNVIHSFIDIEYRLFQIKLDDSWHEVSYKPMIN